MPKPVAAPKQRFSWRLVVSLLLWVAFALGMFWGAREAEAYLSNDPRFVLDCKSPTLPNGCPGIEIRGAVYSNPARLKSIFSSDFGKGLFRIPLANRRSHLLAIDWVNAASISRIWPNKLVVTVTERKPVAFAKLPVTDGRYRMSLIDSEGVLLSLPLRVRFHFPVLGGVMEDQKEADRKVRVEAMQHLLEDLGAESKYVSEVNMTSMLDVKIVADMGGQGVELWVGDQHYRQRFLNFLGHYQEMRKDSPNATIFDLRLDDRILVR